MKAKDFPIAKRYTAEDGAATVEVEESLFCDVHQGTDIVPHSRRYA